MNINSEIATNMNQRMNCRRKNHSSLQPIHSLTLNSVQRATIRSGNISFKHISSNVSTGIDEFILCDECKEYLVSNNNDPKNIWPSFIWHLLSGGHSSKFHGERKFYNVLEVDIYGLLFLEQCVHGG